MKSHNSLSSHRTFHVLALAAGAMLAAGCPSDDSGPAALPAAPLGGNHALATYPTGYETSFTFTTSVDKASNNQVRDMYANDVALQSASKSALDPGSVIVMEIFGARLDGDGNPTMDEDGRFLRDTLNIVAVMEKQTGFGQYSADTKNGEWEYAFYNPDGSRLESESDCYGCHLENAGAATDYIFTRSAITTPDAVAAAPLGGDASKLTFPTDYQASYTFTTSIDKASNNQVRDIYANAAAVGSKDNAVLAHGSVMVMEIYDALLDGEGNPQTDAQGNFMKGALGIVAVMEKKAGNGQYTPRTRNGEWEYAFFNPDGTPIDSEADCFGCHLENAGPGVDFIFSRDALTALP